MQNFCLFLYLKRKVVGLLLAPERLLGLSVVRTDICLDGLGIVIRTLLTLAAIPCLAVWLLNDLGFLQLRYWTHLHTHFLF